MTRQYADQNNVTISTPDDGSVPIVSQTEIEPIKTALSLMFALTTTTALAEPLPVPKPPGPGGSCPHGYIASGSFCMPSSGAQETIAKLAREQQLLPAQRQMTGLNCSPVCVLAAGLMIAHGFTVSARRARATATDHAMRAGWS